ncbi:heme biosynthesis HemY N-terminal domain-containing protein [Sphaerotilus uruguayifluvii]|uniref:HemY protein n=1 Tax=Sphaerotilus uruguayifluvii TaxID=2735897 RepID=A0ABX2G931_9BURK|nr:heme biosynthesis HemY N-terminal domain-containing protein [Leptothrix sp. C29]NRT57957.1 HemY protein [Leptothrix sp. C29]
MRQVVWLLAMFAVAVLAASTFGANDGLVSVYWAPWRVDLSINVFVLLLLAAGFVGHVLVGAVSSLIDLPQRARQWRTQQREQAAQKSLREAIAQLFAGRYGRAHKAAQQALEIRAQSPDLKLEPDFPVLAHLLSASALHRLQDQVRRDEQLSRAQALLSDMPSGTAVGEGARMLAAEWAVDDRDAERALDQLAQLPAGVARRTHALRLKLQATRLARQPLEALKTARLLAKHQGFTPVAAQGLLRSLAVEAIDTARDADQLRRIWLQLDAADRRDPYVAARAARRAAEVEALSDARGWLRPHWERLAELGERERSDVLEAFVEVLPGLPADWLPLLESSVEALPRDAHLAYVAGRAMAERQLWGRAHRLLESAATSSEAHAALRMKAWRALAEIAESEGDEALAQRCYREAARSL